MRSWSDGCSRRCRRRAWRVRSPTGSEVHRELKRKGVTLELLWDEYKASHPDGYQYSTFCLYYRALARSAGSGDAPGTSGRREAVRGLQRTDRAGDRPGQRGGQGGGGVRRRAGRVQLHLCRGDLDAGPERLDRFACAHHGVPWRGAGDRGAGQPEGRRDQGAPLRAEAQPHLPGMGRALRGGDFAGQAEKAEGQGEGRDGRASGSAVDPGAAAQSAGFLPGRTQRSDRGVARAAQHAPVPEAARVPARRCSSRWTARR